MGNEETHGDPVFGSYNAELDRLGCGARVTIPLSRKPATLLLIDIDGAPIGELPTSIQPDAMAAVVLLLEQTFEDGVRTGRTLGADEG